MGAEGGRLMRGARLLRAGVGLEKVRRRWGVVRLRRGHAVDVVGVERRLLEEGHVELVLLATRGRKEGEVAVVRPQEVGLGLSVERQVGVWRGANAGGGLGEVDVGVEDGRVGGVVRLGVGLGLLLLLLGAEEVVGAGEGSVKAAVCGVVLMLMLLLVQAKT